MKESLGTTVKLLPFDLEAMGLSHGNNLALRLRTIDTFPGPFIYGSFMYRAVLYYLMWNPLFINFACLILEYLLDSLVVSCYTCHVQYKTILLIQSCADATNTRF